MAVTQILELPRPAEWHIVHPPHHRNSPHHLVSHPTDSASLLKATGDRLAKHANECLKLRIDTLSITRNKAAVAVELRGIGEPLHDRLTRIEGSENSSFKIGKVEAILLADDNLAAQAGQPHLLRLCLTQQASAWQLVCCPYQMSLGLGKAQRDTELNVTRTLSDV